MGTYHLIDGCKVRVFYRGNRKTCGRCQKSSSDCPGEAIAKNCAAGGGDRVFLSDHMKKLWEQIGFVPTSFELDESDKAEDDLQQATKDVPIKTKTSFPPSFKRQDPSPRDIEHLNGISVRNFPKTLEEKEILQFMINYGVPHDHGSECIKINKGDRNTWLIIDGLSPENVQTIHDSIHFHVTKTKFFDVPLYCKILRTMTPVKSTKEAEKQTDVDKDGEEHTTNTETEMKTNEMPETENNTKSSSTNEDENKSKIPGLPESERLKKKKKKKKKSKQGKEEENLIGQENLSRKDFLISPETGLIKEDGLDNFVFSDYKEDSDSNNDSAESDESDYTFEDSKEVLSDSEKTQILSVAQRNDDFLTPVNLKSTFARTLQATTSTPASIKRQAKSPAEGKDTKKYRSQSQSKIPKK